MNILNYIRIREPFMADILPPEGALYLNDFPGVIPAEINNLLGREYPTLSDFLEATKQVALKELEFDVLGVLQQNAPFCRENYISQAKTLQAGIREGDNTPLALANFWRGLTLAWECKPYHTLKVNSICFHTEANTPTTVDISVYDTATGQSLTTDTLSTNTPTLVNWSYPMSQKRQLLVGYNGSLIQALNTRIIPYNGCLPCQAHQQKIYSASVEIKGAEIALSNPLKSPFIRRILHSSGLEISLEISFSISDFIQANQGSLLLPLYYKTALLFLKRSWDCDCTSATEPQESYAQATEKKYQDMLYSLSQQWKNKSPLSRYQIQIP